MKAQEIYTRAISLIGESAAEGEYNTATFEAAAPNLLNLLCVLLDELDLHIKGRTFRENQDEPAQISSLEDEVHLHPILCSGVMPLGLAFLLLAEEDASRASLFFNLYQTEKDALFRRYRKGRRHRITSVY